MVEDFEDFVHLIPLKPFDYLWFLKCPELRSFAENHIVCASGCKYGLCLEIFSPFSTHFNLVKYTKLVFAIKA